MIKIHDIIHLYLGCQYWVSYVERPDTFTVWSELTTARLAKLDDLSIAKVEIQLRPLSDMTEEEQKELHLQVHKYDTGNLASNLTTDWAYKVCWLVSKHFDLFGLIPSGQAIDSTTINNQNSK